MLQTHTSQQSMAVTHVSRRNDTSDTAQSRPCRECKTAYTCACDRYLLQCLADAYSFISMSVEETNRVRAMLGLKPLNIGGSGSGKPTDDEVRGFAVIRDGMIFETATCRTRNVVLCVMERRRE